MTYHGKFTKGTVVLPPDVDIPEGAEVAVTPVAAESNGEAPENGPTLAEIFQDFIGVCEGLPPDLAENHDHYIHGTPKQRK